MSNYTGKIDLGNVVLTGQGTDISAETSINVTIPDYTEQPFTIVFDTNNAGGLYSLNLGAENTNDYAYRVRLLKQTETEITVVSEWSEELRTVYTAPQSDHNVIQVIGNGPSSYALWQRKQNNGLITSNLQYSVVGNINSLFNADIYATEESALTKSYMDNFDKFNNIQSMFENDTKIKDAYYLYLPYTTVLASGYTSLFENASNLIRGPYRIGPINMEIGQGSVGINGCDSMFLNCTNMVKGPKELKFGSLSGNAYSSMFQQCHSLLNGPEICATNFEGNRVMYMMFDECRSMSACTSELPAETLTERCYGSMFNGCTSLSAAPSILPATTLADYCYSSMFRGCTSLTAAPSILPATTLAERCYGSMFQGCTSLTAAPKLPAKTLKDYCYSSMFQGCTSLTAAPKLPATMLAYSCYFNMFQDCTSLTTVHELSATTLTGSCYSQMFYNCTSLTTAPKLSATKLANNCCYYMFYNCTSLTAAPELPAKTLKDYCYQAMFRGCTSLTAAPKLPAITLAGGCYLDMFRNCTSLRTAPYLPAETLVSNCYDGMFRGCSSLNWIAAMFKSCEGGFGVMNWVDDVPDNGTFVANIFSDDTVTGATHELRYGAPFDWDIDYAVPINGVAWSTRNIGADKPMETGLYFAWGDTQGYTAAQVGSGSGQKYFGWADYKYNNDGDSPEDENMEKYNLTPTGKTVLELSDDAARANLGGLWRMPTTEEYAALGNAVKTGWTTNYDGSGVAGMVCSGITDGSDEFKKLLFFPAVGLCSNGGVRYGGSNGYYWSGSLNSGDALFGRGLLFDSGGAGWQNGSGSRYLGFTVRGVVS